MPPSSASHSAPIAELDSWRITENAFNPANNYLFETLFSVGNGTIGLRGSHEETLSHPLAQSQQGAYLNGFYESEPIHYPETAYGLAKVNEFMLNLPQVFGIALWIDGEQFDLKSGQLLNYWRDLDFRTGILSRKITWRSPKGHEIDIHSERFVSFTKAHLCALRYSIASKNYSGKIILESTMDGRVQNLSAGDDPRVGSHQTMPPLSLVEKIQHQTKIGLLQRTNNSGFEVLSAALEEADNWEKIPENVWAIVSNAHNSTINASHQPVITTIYPRNISLVNRYLANRSCFLMKENR